MTKGISRRSLMKTIGGAAAALPFLELIDGDAYAQGGPPLRLVVMMHPQGMIMNDWRPRGSETDFTFGPILSPLDPYKSQLNILSGISNDVSPLNSQSDGHNSAARTLLTCMPYHENITASGGVKPDGQQVDNGFPGGPSIDQVIATNISQGRRFKTVDLMIGGTELGQTQIFAAGRNDPVRGTADPQAAFNRLFADVAMGPETPATRIRGKRAAVLDVVRRGFSDLGGRLGKADRARLEAHEQKISELAVRLGSGGVMCSPPVVSLPPGYNSNSSNFDNVTAPVMIEEAVMSLACDLTRVVTLQFTQYEGPTFPWLGVDIPAGYLNWHAMIHEARNTGGRPAMVAAMTWYTEMFALLLKRLSEVQDGNGALLDNTLVLWISDFGDGNGHGTWDLPIVLAGGLGGRIPTGRFLDYGGYRTGDLFTSLLNLYGIEASCFGMSSLCRGPLPGLI